MQELKEIRAKWQEEVDHLRVQIRADRERFEKEIREAQRQIQNLVSWDKLTKIFHIIRFHFGN
jgi:aspartate/tyrosine/aromatic aminotransferase